MVCESVVTRQAAYFFRLHNFHFPDLTLSSTLNSEV